MVDVNSSEDFIVGTVKWYNKDKGYGFIKLPGGGVDIFVHANQLRRSGIDGGLEPDVRVQFKTGKGSKGSFATDISVIQAEAS